MMTSFVDGTKSMIEMACLSNATGLVPDIRGMHGPRANINDLTKILIPGKDGGILDKTGVVDFVIGDLAPGVFLVYTTDSEISRKELEYLKNGSGPYFLLYKPYHLASIETVSYTHLDVYKRQITSSVLKGRSFKFGDDISTDLIAPGRYFHLRSNLPELAKHVRCV